MIPTLALNMSSRTGRLAQYGLRASLFAGLAGVGVTVGAATGLVIGAGQLGPINLAETEDLSTVVVDRDNHLLRAFTTKEGRWRLPVDVKDVDPRYLQLLMTFEDRRFYDHSGVDARAMVRAGAQAIRHQRLVSGASTLTMQVARLIERRHERSLARKLRQMVRALQLEAQFSKHEILNLYLRLAPFGGNIEGVRAAALAYFGKEPKRLSLGQAALLVALPQSPESRRPDRFANRARRARNRVLDVAHAAGVISKAEADRAKRESVPRARKPFPMLAPHLAEQEVAAFPHRRQIKTTLRRPVQKSLQALLRTQVRAMGDKVSAALLAVDNATGEVIAYVGSSDYLDGQREGAIDMVQAVRSPGSALKPLIYGLAFESGYAHPEMLIEDRRVRFGAYSPENFDDTFQGAVTIREALGQSLNVPAVKLLDVVGPARFVDRMKRCGVKSALPDGAKPSLAVALGGIGLRMADLARLFSALARGGTPTDLTWRMSHQADRQNETANVHARAAVSPCGKSKSLLSPVASWYVTDILRDAPVPANFRAGQIAYKTGTSYGYRDAWAVGYTAAYTVAVWVGRPDATSTPGLIGRTAAAPILFDAFQRLPRTDRTFPGAPAGAVTASASDLPPPLKRFRKDSTELASGPYATEQLEISFPPDRVALDTTGRMDEPLVLKARGGVLPLTWLVNGAPIEAPPHRRSATWMPTGSGFVDVSVLDANGDAARVNVRLK